MSNSLPDPTFPDSRRLRLEAEAEAVINRIETVVEKIVAPKPVPKRPAAKRKTIAPKKK